MDIENIIKDYYNLYDEDSRFSSRHGRVEYLTTIAYIEKYLRPGMRIIEIGAATGRYSHYFARKGYRVDAVELVEKNIEIFRRNTEPGEDVTITQGNATNLTGIPSDTYDITLLLGPMYHLFSDADKKAALAEAKRVTKPGGLLYVSYCMNEASIINFGFVKGNIRRELEKGTITSDTFKCTSVPEYVFEIYRREEIDALTEPLGMTRLHFVGTDMYTRYFKDVIKAMDDETFELYLRYHMFICERPDMTGLSHHTLDILQKTEVPTV